MFSPRSLAVAIVSIGVGLIGAFAFESIYDVRVSARAVRVSGSNPSRTDAADTPEAARERAPLPLRLVDSGGVGIPLDSWGRNYSHDLKAFREVILREPPYIDETVLRRVDSEWRAYVERMLEYGNNAIAVPLLLEFIDFTRLESAHRGDAEASVYESPSRFPARHRAVRQHLAPLFDWTHRRGMHVFLSTDMLPLTPPLERYLRRVAPASNALGINASDPAIWDVYRAGLEELFDTLPSIDGVVIRVGEAGSLYNTEGWEYGSAMAIRDARSLRAMLRGLLPLFEARGKTLVLRSWTVGVGPIGRLHVDPDVYQAVL